MAHIEENVLKSIVRTIVNTASPHKVILFGSAARGQALEGSDLDILVMISGTIGPVRSRYELYTDLMRRLARFGVVIDLLLFTQREMKEWQPYRNHVISRAMREGKVLYEKAQARRRAAAKSTR